MTVLRLLRRHPALLTALLCVPVLATGFTGPDLPAQTYRADLARRFGYPLFDTHWYGGHALPGYSLLAPTLSALVGPAVLAALACIVATGAFARLLRGPGGTGHDLAVVWFAVVSVVDLVVGRVPFACGLAAGVAALVALREDRPATAAAMSVLCGAFSPLAGVFLLLAAAAALPDLSWRRVAPAAGSIVGPAAAAAFGEGGSFPFPAVSLLEIVLLAAAMLLVVPAASAAVRRGAALYALASAAVFAVPNALGGNMSRLAAVVAGPVLAETLGPGRRRLLALLAVPVLIWQFQAVPISVSAGTSPAADPAYYTGLVGYLAAHVPPGERVEVAMTASRVEQDVLAREVSLARGWERQLDYRYAAVLYDDGLDPARYRRWLDANAVGWVALPDAHLDGSEEAEARLLRAGTVPGLRLAWQDAHWRLWQVSNPVQVVDPPARIEVLAPAAVQLDAPAPGSLVLRVRWTPFWQVTRGDACLHPGADGWTAVQVRTAGVVRLEPRWSWSALAGAGPGCG